MNDTEQKIWGVEQPFTVPEGYFDNIEKQLKERIVLSESVKKKTSMMSWFGIAATVVVAVLLYNLIPEKSLPNEIIPTLSTQNEYVLINIPIEGLDEYDLIEYIKDQNLDIDVFPDSLFFLGIN